MDIELIAIAERLIEHERRSQRGRIELEVRKREWEAIERREIRKQYYADEQTRVCINELNTRADVIWQSFTRVAAQAGVAWTADLREDVGARAETFLKRDAESLDNLAKEALWPHGHSFNLPVHEALPHALDRVRLELDLFALKYQPRQSPLDVQLSAPRYASPRQHWRKSNRMLVAEPPDLENAVKEAVSMVEALAKITLGEPRKTLGDCIRQLRHGGRIDGATAKAWEGLWGLVNTEAGVRHGHINPPEMAAAQARYAVGHAESAAKLLLALHRPSAV